MISDADWTDADLAIVQSLDAAGTPLELIARQLGRDPAAVEDKLPIARARHHTIPVPAPKADGENDWLGPDEEGDVLPPDARADDPSAWVHEEKRR